MNRRGLTSVVLIVVAIALLIPAAWGLRAAGDGVTRSQQTVNDIPVTLLTPQGGGSDLPAVVMLHGFAASSVIMEPLGRVLVRAGYVVALPDQRGHGRNTAALGGDENRDQLQGDLALLVDWLSARPEVDPTRLGVVGHSMGAGVATDFAMAQPEGVLATVAISLPDAVAVETRPRNVLFLFGANEPSRFKQAAAEQMQLIQPGAQIGQFYGDFAAGTGAQALEIPLVEHITIVWSEATAQAMLDWLDASVGVSGGVIADLDPAWLWLLLLLGAGCVGFVPLARGLYGRGSPRRITQTVPAWQSIAITAVSAVAAAVILGVTPGGVIDLIPVAVGGYLTLWFALMAIVIAVALRVLPTYPRREFQPGGVRAAAASVALSALITMLLVISARLTWATAEFGGSRWWVTMILAMVLLGYFYADAVLLYRASLPGRIAVLVAHRVIVALALLLAVVLLGAPGILTLLVPVMVLMFAVLGYFAVVASTQTTQRFAPAVIQAVPLAAIVGSGFPLL